MRALQRVVADACSAGDALANHVYLNILMAARLMRSLQRVVTYAASAEDADAADVRLSILKAENPMNVLQRVQRVVHHAFLAEDAHATHVFSHIRMAVRLMSILQRIVATVSWAEDAPAKRVSLNIQMAARSMKILEKMLEGLVKKGAETIASLLAPDAAAQIPGLDCVMGDVARVGAAVEIALGRLAGALNNLSRYPRFLQFQTARSHPPHQQGGPPRSAQTPLVHRRVQLHHQGIMVSVVHQVRSLAWIFALLPNMLLQLKPRHV